MGRPRKNPDDPKWDLPAPEPYRDDEPVAGVIDTPTAEPAPVNPPNPPMQWRTTPAGFRSWGDRLETVEASNPGSWSGGWWRSKPEERR